MGHKGTKRFALLLILSAVASQTVACEPNDRFAEFLERPIRAFVGTVIGYRLEDTTLAVSAPDCPFRYDDERLSRECEAFWDRVVSIQYDVEIAIGGIEAGRKYETSVWNPDGCVPRIGERWLTSGWHRDGFSTRLEAMPSPEQIESWRAINHSDEQ